MGVGMAVTDRDRQYEAVHRVANVTVRIPPMAELETVAEVFVRQVGVRSGTAVMPGPSCVIELGVDGGLGAETYAIADGPDGAVRVCGGDRRGLLYGLGKLLRESRFEPGRFIPGDWRGVSRPAKPVRGIYFATHFYNFYQTAPVAQIERYVEELALWGMNALAVWYDMHHFRGFDDPEAVVFRGRLGFILRAARRLGLDTWLLVVGNDGLVLGAMDGTPLGMFFRVYSGVAVLAYLWADAPDALRDCFAVMEANYLTRLKIGVQSDIDVVVSVDDTSTTAISPAMFESCNLGLTDARADAAHAAGKLYFHHSCGLGSFHSRGGGIPPSHDGADEVCRRLLPRAFATAVIR